MATGFGPKCPNIVVGNAAKLPLAEVLFKDLYGGYDRRNTSDAGHLAAIHVLGWYEVLLFEVRREIEKRHVFFRERAPASRIDFREKLMDQVAGVDLVLCSSLTIVSLAGDRIGVGDARPPRRLRTFASTFSFDN